MAYPQDYTTIFLQEQLELIRKDIVLADNCMKKYPHLKEYFLLKEQAQKRVKIIVDELKRRKSALVAQLV